MLPICQLAGILTGSGGGGVAPDVDPPNALALFRQPFAEDSMWRVYPVSPVLSAPGRIHDNGTNTPPNVEQGGYSTGVYRAYPTDPPMTIYPRGRFPVALQIADTKDGESAASFTVDHWPAGITVDNSSLDGHVSIITPCQMRNINLYGVQYNSADYPGKWSADIYCWTPLGGRGIGDPVKPQQGARAGTSPADAGLIRTFEVDGGVADVYDHVLGIGLDYACLTQSPRFIYPMCNADGDVSGNGGVVPYGALVMLPPDFDPNFTVNLEIRKIARTLMQIGGRIQDRVSGPQFVIYAEEGSNIQITQDLFSYARDAGDLKVIGDNLCVVESVSGWKQIADDADVPELQSDFNLMSMRGDWTNGAVFDIHESAVIMPAAGTYTSTDGTSIRRLTAFSTYGASTLVDWAGPTFADVNTLTIRGDAGVQGKIQIKDGSGNLLRETAMLGVGGTADVTFGQFEFITKVATSPGANKKIWFDVRDKSKPAVDTITVSDGSADVTDIRLTKPIWGLLPDPSVFTSTGGLSKTATRVYVDYPYDSAGGSMVVHVAWSQPYVHGDSSTVSITPSGTRDLHDAQGNKLLAVVNKAVTNNLTVDTTKPTFTVSVSEDDPTAFDLVFSEPIVGTFAASSCFTFTSGRTVVSATKVDSRHATVVGNSRIYLAQSESIIYTKPGLNPIKDASNNEMNTATVAVTNNTTEGFPEFLRLTALNLTATNLIESGNGGIGYTYTGTSGHVAAGSPANKGIPTGTLGFFECKLGGAAFNASNYLTLYGADGTHSWSVTAAASFIAGADGSAIGGGVGAPVAGDWIRVDKVDRGSGVIGFLLKYSHDNKASWVTLAGGVITDADWAVEVLTSGSTAAIELTGGNVS